MGVLAAGACGSARDSTGAVAVAGTPAGPARIVARGGSVVSIEFVRAHEECDRFGPSGGADESLAREAARQLEAYARGGLTRFDLPLAPVGTEFQRRVWGALREIAFGATTTYGALARLLGDAKSVRAVGGASGANPFAIVVPCHRVVGSDGGLTGYAGGLERKRALLEHEGALRAGTLFAG